MATAVLGATLAEWQRKREEEEARQRELDRIAQQEKNARKREEKARLEYLNAAYQAKLDREKEKQIAVSAARWNGLAQIEQAKEKAKQIAVSAARWTGIAQIEQEKEKVNVIGSKPLLKPVPQDPNPPNIWESIANWANENIVEPVVNIYNQTATNVTNFVNSAIKWTNDNVVQPTINLYNQTVSIIKNIATNTYNNAVNFIKQDVPLWVDNKLDEIYDYHGPINPPSNVTGQVWSAFPNTTPASPNFSILILLHKIHQIGPRQMNALPRLRYKP
jgi:hypothetical protein